MNQTIRATDISLRDLETQFGLQRTFRANGVGWIII